MGKTIQIRDVNEHTYTVLRTRAAAEHLSLTAYLKRELEKMAAGPTMAEWLARVDRTVPKVDISRDEIVDALHEARRERDEHLDQLWRR